MKQQKEKDAYISSLKNFNDRELQELQTYFARKTMDYAKSTNYYLFVIFGITVLSMVIGFIIAASK